MHSKRNFLLLAAAAGFINLLPLLFIIPPGDAVMNYMQLECFSKHVWQGLFYPHWCMDANGGMGSPGPIFYFPFAFWATSIFYPLGLGVENQYLLGHWLNNSIAFVTCCLWLRRIVGFRMAAYCAFLFLFLFYRVEIAATRQSFAELWAVTFLPLVFMYTHQLLYENKRVWIQLALSMALCLLCHPPATLIGLMAAGIQVLWAPNRVRNLLQFAGAGVVATLMTLFHTLPMKLLINTTNPEVGGINHWRRSWLNSFIDSKVVVTEFNIFLIALVMVLMMSLFVGIRAWRGRQNIPDSGIRHETVGWLLVMTFGFIMTLSLTEPLWQLIELVSGVKTPWRMSSLVMFGLVYILAVSMRWIWRDNPKTRTGDRAMVAFLVLFFSLFYYGGIGKDGEATWKRMIAGQFVIPYFSTSAISTDYKYIDKFYHDFIDRPHRKRAEWIKGSGPLSVRQWNERGIVVRGDARGTGRLRLEHFAYPIWQASINGYPAIIQTEGVTGRMLVDIPPGDFTLVLTQDYRAMLPDWYITLCLLPWAGLLLAVARLRRSATHKH